MKKEHIYSIMAVLLLAVIAFLFFLPDNIEGNTLQQSDIRQGLANGQEGKEFNETTGETTRWTNSLFSGMPNFQISPSYPSSSLLTWIGKVYSLGLPSPSNLLFIMFLGFFIMCLCMKMKWYTSLLGAVAWGFSTYFIIIIGAGHIWKFITLSYIPPTIGGIILCYRGRYMVGTLLASLFGALQLQGNHPQMTYYFLFVILFISLVLLWNAIKEKTVKRWGIATGCVVLAGVLGFAANLSSLYNTYEYSKETIRGKSTEIVSDDKPAATGLEFDYITAWSYGVDETFTLLIPNVKGGASVKPVEGQNYGKFALDYNAMQQYGYAVQQLYGQRVNQLYNSGAITSDGNVTEQAYNELAAMQQLQQPPTEYFGEQPMTNGPVYVGAFILVLAVLAMFVVDNRLKWALFAATILSVLLAWGHNFPTMSQWFIDNFPAYNKFRTVSSILVIAEFTIPLLAVMCVHKMVTTPEFFVKNKKIFFIVTGFGAMICLLGWVMPSMFGQALTMSETRLYSQTGAFDDPTLGQLIFAVKDARMQLVSSDSLRSLLFILVGTAIVWFYFNKTKQKSAAVFVCLLTLLTIFDLYTVNKRYVDTENFTTDNSNDAVFEPTSADLTILKDTAMNYRVMDKRDFAGARSSYFHKTIGGYHAAKLTRYNDLIEHQINRGNMRVLNMLNAKYFIDTDTAQQPIVTVNPEAMGNAWLVSKVKYVDNANGEMSALDDLDVKNIAVADKKFAPMLGNGIAKAQGDTIFETSYQPNRLTYHCVSKSGGIAVFSEVYFPWGWTAKIDGNEVEIARVNYVLRALKIPSGVHSIEFRFDPQSLHITDVIATIALLSIYLLAAVVIGRMVIGEYKKRKFDIKK